MASRGIGTHIKRLLGDPEARVLEDTPAEPRIEEAGNPAGITASRTKSLTRNRQAFAVTAERGTSAERLLLNRLGVFFDGWTLEATKAVCGGSGIAEPEVESLLTRLADASLVVREEKDGKTRYSLPEEPQARRRFEATEEAETLRRRHRDYFLQWAAQAGRTQQPRDPSVRPEKSVSEYANLWAALLWSQRQNETAATLLLASALSRLCSTRTAE